MAKFRIEEIDEGVLEGYISIGGVEIETNLDSDKNEAKMEDFKDLILQAERFADYFTDEKQLNLKQAVAKEIVDSALEQDGIKAAEEDYLSLQSDLKLIDLYVFDEGFVLTYKSENNFPANDISVQLDEDGMIDDIAIYDENEYEEE